MQRDLASLLDIHHAASMAFSFVEGMTFDQFSTDAKTQAAVMLEIIIIGEASRRISTEFRAAHSELPWPQILGIRNRLVHEYEKVKLPVVWDTVQNSLPPLIAQIAPLILPKE